MIVPQDVNQLCPGDNFPGMLHEMGHNPQFIAGQLYGLASGAGKAQAVYDSCFGPVTPHVPASVLHLHSDVVVIADQDALALVKQKAGLFVESWEGMIYDN